MPRRTRRPDFRAGDVVHLVTAEAGSAGVVTTTDPFDGGEAHVRYFHPDGRRWIGAGSWHSFRNLVHAFDPAPGARAAVAEYLAVLEVN